MVRADVAEIYQDKQKRKQLRKSTRVHFWKKTILTHLQGAINPLPISDIRWLPNNENLFLAAHADGTLVVYDKEKEDASFVAEEQAASSEKASSESERRVALQIKKSVQSKSQKTNPVACWKVSNSKINAFAFSPDSRHLAVVSEDGSLRIIDFLKEQ